MKHIDGLVISMAMAKRSKVIDKTVEGQIKRETSML
jgi:hypothetical protein